MIIEFRCYEFNHRYKKHCDNISIGNTFPPGGAKSTYWMFDNESNGKTEGDWTTSSQLKSKEISAMNYLKKVLFDVLNE